MKRLVVIVSLVSQLSSLPAVAAEPDDVRSIEACLSAEASRATQSACIGKLSETCQALPETKSTIEMNACISREADAWDAVLNQTYKSELASAKAIDAERSASGDTDASAAASLLKAQRAWIAYRDAECDRRFELYKDGTIRTTLSAYCILDLTATRVLNLQPLV